LGDKEEIRNGFASRPARKACAEKVANRLGMVEGDSVVVVGPHPIRVTGSRKIGYDVVDRIRMQTLGTTQHEKNGQGSEVVKQDFHGEPLCDDT